jgi:BolA protein
VRLTEQLAPTWLDIQDESSAHAGHLGAQSGRGHFKLSIRSPLLAGKTLLEQHRIIYAALAEEMQTLIHALSIEILQ